MPLQQTSGNDTSDAYGGGVAAVPNYIESCFSTYLYTGNGSTQTITNGIDLAGKGGMSWIKSRSNAYYPNIVDTARGAGNTLTTAATDPNGSVAQSITAFNVDGFTLGTSTAFNGSGATFVSWTFRKQPKFFDVVTYTGNGVTGPSGGRLVSHSLGSKPGFIIVKRTDSTGDWFCSSRQNGTTDYIASDSFYSSYFCLNRTNGNGIGMLDSYIVPNTTQVDVAMMDYTQSLTNINGASYVMYVFAHNSGGFGLTGTDNVISCGSYTGNGSTTGPVINLGYEPQWLMVKNASGVGSWYLVDNMRGITADGSIQTLYANLSNAEATSSAALAVNSTGFQPTTTSSALNGSGSTYIYIAIRRGPMKVPTDATKVFAPVTYTGNNVNSRVLGGFGNRPDVAFLVDRDRNGYTQSPWVEDRLRGASAFMATNTTNAESTAASGLAELWNNSVVFGTTAGSNWNSSTYLSDGEIWGFTRAPGFFDEICWTSTGSAQSLSHNLQVVPELVIIKQRSAINDWIVLNGATASNFKYMFLNYSDANSGAVSYSSTEMYSAQPTATTLSLGNQGAVSASGGTFVAYLFATCAGVSKVFSFTGNGTTQTINCGFTGGARFVLLKATSTTGGWFVYDTARGMTTLTDPYLQLNTTAAETATLGSVTTVSTGFAVNESILTGVNTNGVSYIGLAIA